MNMWLLAAAAAAVYMCCSKHCWCREERCTADGKCDEDVKIVAVDLQAMAPIPGVIQIQGDITKVPLTYTEVS